MYFASPRRYEPLLSPVKIDYQISSSLFTPNFQGSLVVYEPSVGSHTELVRDSAMIKVGWNQDDVAVLQLISLSFVASSGI
jgi:hypothetical protein